MEDSVRQKVFALQWQGYNLTRHFNNKREGFWFEKFIKKVFFKTGSSHFRIDQVVFLKYKHSNFMLKHEYNIFGHNFKLRTFSSILFFMYCEALVSFSCLCWRTMNQISLRLSYQIVNVEIFYRMYMYVYLPASSRVLAVWCIRMVMVFIKM